MPVVLAVIGLAVLAAGFLVYPRRHQPAAPGSVFVTVAGPSHYVDAHMGLIHYTVDQLHPDLAQVTVQVDGGNVHPGAPVGVLLTHLGTTTVARCSPSCTELAGEHGVWDALSSFGTDGTATIYFFLKASSFAVAANGETAEAVFPAMASTGTHPTTVTLSYHIPSANTYDWSSTPPALLCSSRAVWIEPVPAGTASMQGLAQLRVASGLNRAAETHDSNLTLAAGVLFGLAGGALVAAVQEALQD